MEVPMAYREVAILDVTRMRSDRVCIAGVMRNSNIGYEEVRPVFWKKPITRHFLDLPCGSRVEPFVVLGFTFVKKKCTPPHVEDLVFRYMSPKDVVYVRKLNEPARQSLLEKVSKDSLSAIFGDKLVDNKFIYENEEGRSLGCLKIESFGKFFVKQFEEKLSIRFGFKTELGWKYYSVTDLKIHEFIRSRAGKGREGEVKSDEVNPDALSEIVSMLTERIRDCGVAYLRFGLSRPYLPPDDESDDKRKKCFVQINGIHTFPDFLA